MTIALLLALAPQTFAAGTWMKSVSAAQKVAKEKNQLILVDMFAEWCGWCHRFEREVFPSSVFQNATSDIVLLRLDTEDGSEGTMFARKYSVTSLPTFLLLSPDLSLAGVLRGYAPANDFAKSLKDTRVKYEAFMKRSQNEAAIAKDPVQRLALAKEYVQRATYDKSEPRLRKLVTEKGIPVAVRDEAYYQLALSYALQRRYTDGHKAVNDLRSVSKVGDWVEHARLLSAQMYVDQGNLLAAVNELRSFKAAFPKSPLNANVDMVLPAIEKQLAMQQQ